VDQRENRIALSAGASPPECFSPSHRQEYAAAAFELLRSLRPGQMLWASLLLWRAKSGSRSVLQDDAPTWREVDSRGPLRLMLRL
jgi:hypothetical protein